MFDENSGFLVPLRSALEHSLSEVTRRGLGSLILVMIGTGWIRLCANRERLFRLFFRHFSEVAYFCASMYLRGGKKELILA